MNTHLKDTLRSLAEATGLEVRKTSVYTSQKLRHQLLFSQLPIDLVLDVGATTGEVEINIAANSYSSSILPMLDSHLAAAPHSAYLQKEKVPLRRLDDIVPATAPGRYIFLKLDVQGYESQVLAGATHLLNHTLAVQLEMSLLPLYEGEALMPQMHAALTAKGFDLWDLEPSFRDPATGRLLQLDGIFIRSSFDPSFNPSARLTF